MKILQEIKQNYAKGQGFDSWELMRQNQGIDNVDLNIICKEYATQCVLASLKKAELRFDFLKYQMDDKLTQEKISESITNPENIVLL